MGYPYFKILMFILGRRGYGSIPYNCDPMNRNSQIEILEIITDPESTQFEKKLKNNWNKMKK